MSYVHKPVGIAKRLYEMYVEETTFPRRDIYVGCAQNARHPHIHSMSIDCFVPRKNFGEFTGLDLNKMLINTSEFLPTGSAKIVQKKKI